MSLSAVRRAAKQERPSAAKIAAARNKCFRRYAQRAVKRLKYLLPPAKAGPYTVAIATEKPDQADSVGLTLSHGGWGNTVFGASYTWGWRIIVAGTIVQ